METPTPNQVASKLQAIADGIDRSKNPDPARVAAEIRKIMLALSPERPARRASKAKPVRLAFEGELGDGDQMRRAAEYIAKKYPSLKGRKLSFKLVAEPAD